MQYLGTQSIIINLYPRSKVMNCQKVFDMFYQEALPIFHVDSLLTIGDTGEKLAAMLKIQISNSLLFAAGNGAFSCGVSIFVWVLINKCGCCNQNKSLYSPLHSCFYSDRWVLY